MLGLWTKQPVSSLRTAEGVGYRPFVALLRARRLAVLRTRRLIVRWLTVHRGRTVPDLRLSVVLCVRVSVGKASDSAVEQGEEGWSV
jgi:hypothetical protein